MSRSLDPENVTPNIILDFENSEFQPVITEARRLIRKTDSTVFIKSDRHQLDYFVVQLLADDDSFFLLMLQTSLYVTAFIYKGKVYEFKGFKEFNNSTKLHFNESYPDVTGHIGFYEFKVAVLTLMEAIGSLTPNPDDWMNNIFLVIIHVAEAMRFHLFSSRIDETQDYRADPLTINEWIMLLVRNWHRISDEAVKYAGEAGGLNEKGWARLLGRKRKDHTYQEHLEWILSIPRLCKNLLAIPLGYGY